MSESRASSSVSLSSSSSSPPPPPPSPGFSVAYAGASPAVRASRAMSTGADANDATRKLKVSEPALHSLSELSLEDREEKVLVSSLGGVRRVRKRNGYLGNLSEAQEQALASLRELVTPAERAAAGDDNSSDYGLLRFLRARNFQVGSAHEMFHQYGEWRKTEEIDSLSQEKLPKFDLLRKLIPRSHHGYDREGRPVLYEKTGNTDPSVLAALVTPTEFLRYHTLDQEVLAERCKKSSESRGEHVETWTMVLDLTGVNINHQRGLELLKLCSDHDQRYYPERLARLIIINAPFIFPMMYKMASHVLDKKTKQKITVAYGDIQETLLKYIAADQLPAEYGGACVCPHQPGQNTAVPGCVPEYTMATITKAHPTVFSKLQKGQEVKQPSDRYPLKEATILAGEKFELVFESNCEFGATVGWSWNTEANDINFSVEHYAGSAPAADGAGGRRKLDASKKRIVQPVQRCYQHQGSFTTHCTGPSTVKLVWDNSYSYFTSKTIKYRAALLELPTNVLREQRSRTSSTIDLDEDKR